MLERLPWWTGAALAAASLLLLVGAPLVALLDTAGDLPWNEIRNNTWLHRVLRFSLVQASLSTLAALIIAIPVACALHHRRRFVGRRWLVNLFGLSLVLPSIAAVYGLIAVWGNAGWANALLEIVGAPSVPVLYGLTGILLAHVFFNAPLMSRVLLQALDGIPEHEWRLAAQLGMPASTRFWRLEWPVITRQLPALLTLVFTLCFTSFAVVLALGGGPRATTIEVAIYQALRFDFDLPLAVALAMIQLAVCLALTLLGGLTGRGDNTQLGLAGSHVATADWPAWHPHTRRSVSHRLLDGSLVVLMSLLVVPPLLAIVLSGINHSTWSVLTDPVTLTAVWRTLVAAIAAAGLSIVLALCLLSGVRHVHVRFHQARAADALQVLGNVILVVPPIVLGTGLFLVLRAHADVFALALLLVIIINALMALPFALRLLAGPVLDGADARDRLAQSLGMPRTTRWRYIDAPLLRRPIAHAAAIAATLSAGDLGAIALFGSERMQTLPLLLHTRLGSHRLEEAAVTAMLLVTLCFALYTVTARLIGGAREQSV